MRALKLWLFALAMASPAAIRAVRKYGGHGQCQGALGQRSERGRARARHLGRARTRYPRRLAHLLAQSRRLRQADKAGLAAARRELRRATSSGPRRIASRSRPSSITATPSTPSPGARSRRRRILQAGSPLALAAKASWLVCSDVCIPERRELAVDAAGRAPRPAPSIRRRPRCSPPHAPSCPARSRRRLPRGFEGDKLIITLGQEWGATLAQITSLAFYPYDDGRHRVRGAADADTHQGCRRSRDESRLSTTQSGRDPRRAGGDRTRTARNTDTVPIEIAATLFRRRSGRRQGGPALRTGGPAEQATGAFVCRPCCCSPCWAA